MTLTSKLTILIVSSLAANALVVYSFLLIVRYGPNFSILILMWLPGLFFGLGLDLSVYLNRLMTKDRNEVAGVNPIVTLEGLYLLCLPIFKLTNATLFELQHIIIPAYVILGILILAVVKKVGSITTRLLTSTFISIMLFVSIMIGVNMKNFWWLFFAIGTSISFGLLFIESIGRQHKSVVLD